MEDELSDEEKDLILWGWEMKYPALFDAGREPRYSRKGRTRRRITRARNRITPHLSGWGFLLAMLPPEAGAAVLMLLLLPHAILLTLLLLALSGFVTFLITSARKETCREKATAADNTPPAR